MQAYSFAISIRSTKVLRVCVQIEMYLRGYNQKMSKCNFLAVMVILGLVSLANSALSAAATQWANLHLVHYTPTSGNGLDIATINFSGADNAGYLLLKALFLNGPLSFTANMGTDMLAHTLPPSNGSSSDPRLNVKMTPLVASNTVYKNFTLKFSNATYNTLKKYAVSESGSFYINSLASFNAWVLVQPEFTKQWPYK